jgi:drug/metabolite transporter (DMT)-like permease
MMRRRPTPVNTRADTEARASPRTAFSAMVRHMRGKLAIGIFAVLVAGPAQAHGEDVLTYFYTQAAAVAVTMYFLFSIRMFRRYWLVGILGCVAGVVISWLATDRLPYTDNHVLINTIGSVAPLLFAALAVVAAHRYVLYRRNS